MTHRLSRPIDRIAAHYPVVVVGSGYGGAIAASRLARAGQRVCLLERGKELQPGQYPNTAAEAADELQISGPEGHVGSLSGLYDLHVNPGMSVFVGCGLGGTSLVNANVALRAEPRVFQDARWPALVGRDESALEPYYTRAEEMLQPNPYPDDLPALPKLAALEASAAQLGGRFYRPPINVTFTNRVNAAGVEQRACNLCGDCVSGCNQGAKNTVLMNYLPDAVRHGAEIYTQVRVGWLERRAGGWIVHYQMFDSGRTAFDAPDLFVAADVVVVAAGTLGSTEILLRSRAKGLSLSDRLGHRFTGNGDVLAFGYNADRRVDGIGFGHRNPTSRPPVGPCITGVIDLREQPRLEHGMVIEEGAIPGALGRYLPPVFAALAHGGVNSARGTSSHLRQRARELDSLLLGPYAGALRNTQTYLVMTHDQDAGRLRLDSDRVVVDWNRVGFEEIFQLVDERLRGATSAIQGVHIRDPLWSQLTGDSLITVHPLGGCVMADDAGSGVVDHRQRVFASSSGDEVHDGLYVADGAVVPCPLGVNPLLTISALSERAMALLARDRGWTIDYSLSSVPMTSEAPEPAPVGIEFTERMSGWFAAGAPQDDYEAAAERGRSEGSDFTFVLTITSQDLEAMLRDPEHRARMVGTVTASRLSSAPLQVTDGDFNLFEADPADPDTKRMRYRMRLTAEDGTDYFVSGFKLMQESNWTRLWPQTTTLYITVHAGPDQDHPVLGQGVLNISPEDFAKQMTTMRALRAPSETARLEAVARFGLYFAGVLFHTYGGVHLRPASATQPAAVRKKRELRLPVAEVHPLMVAGDRSLLTRYPGGDRGPVLLVPGADQSAAIFTLDTAETSLTEYLSANGHDVWLLDHRGSPALAGNGDCALDGLVADVCAALAQVRRVTGAGAVSALGHGLGATALLRALMAADASAGAVVCSSGGLQVGGPTDPVHLERLSLPIAFLDGPTGAALATFELLRRQNGPDRYSYLAARGCSETDCITGPNAARDVYPWLLAHLVAP